MQKTEQIKWLNCAKAVAIVAVLIDHTTGILYSSQTIATASYFSVSLFILIAGMTSYLSDSRHAESCCQNFVRSTRKIVEAYIIAAGVCTVLSSKGFDLLEYLSHLIHFDASLPHYFVLLYVQLMVENRFLFNLLQTIDKKNNIQSLLGNSSSYAIIYNVVYQPYIRNISALIHSKHQESVIKT